MFITSITVTETIQWEKRKSDFQFMFIFTFISRYITDTLQGPAVRPFNTFPCPAKKPGRNEAFTDPFRQHALSEICGVDLKQPRPSLPSAVLYNLLQVSHSEQQTKNQGVWVSQVIHKKMTKLLLNLGFSDFEEFLPYSYQVFSYNFWQLSS